GMNRIQLVNVVELGTRVILLLGLVVFVWGLDLGVTGAAWTDAVACIGTAVVLGIVLGSVKAWCMPTWDSTLWRRVAVFALAVPPLRWLLPGIFTLSIGKVLVAELLAREKPRYTVWASGAAVAANIIGNLLLVPRMGISGAALASSVSYTIMSSLLIWYYLRVTGLPWTVLIPRAADLSAYRALWRRMIRGRAAPASPPG